MDRRLLIRFYHATVESLLTYCITVWYAGCSAADKKTLQGVVRTAEKIIGCQLPPLEDVASTRYLSRAQNITRDCTHPGHGLFELLQSGRHYRSAKIHTSRFRDRFFPRAINILNRYLHYIIIAHCRISLFALLAMTITAIIFYSIIHMTTSLVWQIWSSFTHRTVTSLCITRVCVRLKLEPSNFSYLINSKQNI